MCTHRVVLAEPLPCPYCCRRLVDAAYSCYWLGGKSMSLRSLSQLLKEHCSHIYALVHDYWHTWLRWLQILPPIAYAHQPATNFNTRFVHVSLNKVLIIHASHVALCLCPRQPQQGTCLFETCFSRGLVPLLLRSSFVTMLALIFASIIG